MRDPPGTLSVIETTERNEEAAAVHLCFLEARRPEKTREIYFDFIVAEIERWRIT